MIVRLLARKNRDNTIGLLVAVRRFFGNDYFRCVPG